MKRALTGALAAACAVAAMASPALAKGIQSAQVSGPGLDEPISLSGYFNGDESTTDVYEFATATGFFDTLSNEEDPGEEAKRPDGDLGRRYLATYDWMVGADETVPVRQRLYPFAEGGAVSFTRAGQPLIDGYTTNGGWYRAGDVLTELLIELGIPVRPNRDQLL